MTPTPSKNPGRTRIPDRDENLGLFRSVQEFGIPSISSFLLSTGQLASPATSSKRAADTGVILTEVVINKPASQRTIDCIARMNYLHGGYRKAGKISDADMLYTLSLFALEPSRWIRRYEWRTLTDMEQCAVGNFWKSLGDDMLIPYTLLASGQNGWRDGLQWIEELEEWSLRYEEANMIPSDSSHKLATGTVDLLLWKIPKRWRRVAGNFVTALLEQRLWAAMMLTRPPSAYYTIIDAVVVLRKLFLRYLALPRPAFMRMPYVPDDLDPKTGRYHPLRYRLHPWYIKPTFKKRWGVKAWQIWMVGGSLPGDEGDKYHPEGYSVAEVGPEYKRGKGVEEMDATKARLGNQDRGGCPFGVPRGPRD